MELVKKKTKQTHHELKGYSAKGVKCDYPI